MKLVPVCDFNGSTSSNTVRPCLGIKIQAVFGFFRNGKPMRDLVILSFHFKRLNVYDIKRNFLRDKTVNLDKEAVYDDIQFEFKI